ncbi:P-loop containing nucleoside triphosphate hydrolase protein [Obelidium mucronatum]|nr:P-loop containing nucleoside triphosphate hydrolase protein [Obelidium mucronatum]
MALQNVTEEYVTACANITYHHNHIAFPQSGLNSLVRTDSNAVLRTVSDSTKIFDVTSSIDLLAESFSDRKSRISLPYLLDCFQEDAINVKQTAVIIGRGGTGKTSVLARKLLMAHQTAIETESTLRSQLFVTQSSMLVRRIEAEYKSLLETFHATSGLPKWSEIPKEVALFLKAPKFMSFFDLLQDVDIIAGVPESRLFWTDFDESKFDQLVLLQGSSKALRFKNSRITVKNQFVNFERFDNVYYSYASFDLRKSYSAAFLFTQIMSVIKNVDSNGVKTVIGRDEFLAMTTSTIVSRDRHSIWDFYLRYEQEKRSRFQLDMLDIMANILSRCSTSKLPLQDIIFIDEVQDLMPCQLFLFDNLRDENTGVVCSGDQAQAITAGMDFRFSKLKAELHRKYKVPPAEVHLTLNYRTAEPIMKLSNQVLDVIRHFFPNDLDSIPQEQSSGAAVSNKPRIFENEELESLKYLFLDSPNFSAEQAIIVPSAKVKSVLNDKILSFRGSRNLVPTILTVLEAKGLEFDDIVLFNLFSNCDSVHQVLLNFDSKRSSGGYIPEFQMAKHGFLCHELKQLYVAITRAKKRLLVIDNSESRSSYMRILGDLIEHTTVAKEKPFSTGLQSTIKAWEARGFEFKASTVRMYEEAAKLYKKLSNPSRMVLCYSEGRLFDKLFKTLQRYATVLGSTICDLQYESLAGNLSKTSALFYKCCDAIKSDLVALGLLERSFVDVGFEQRRLIDAYVSRNALSRSLEFFIRSRPKAPLFECAIKVASEFPSEWPSLQPQYGALFKDGATIKAVDVGLTEKMDWKKLTVRLVHSKGSSYYSNDFSCDLEPSDLYKLLEKASLHPICGILFPSSNGCSSVDSKPFVSSKRWDLLPPLKYASNVVKLIVEDVFISLAKQGAHTDSRVLFASRNRSFETVFIEKGIKSVEDKRYYFMSYLEEALEAGKVEISDVLNAYIYHQKLDQAKSMALKNPYELKKVFIRNDDFFLEQFKEQSQMHAKLHCINSLKKLNLRYKCIEAVSGVQDAFSAVKELPDDPKSQRQILFPSF